MMMRGRDVPAELPPNKVREEQEGMMNICLNRIHNLANPDQCLPFRSLGVPCLRTDATA